MRLRIQSLILFLFFSHAAGQLHGQVKLAPTVEANLSYENGVYMGFGLGIRLKQAEFIPSFLAGLGYGGKLEFRWYQRFSEGYRLRPFFTLQQVVFHQFDTCFPDPCPYTFYQLLPGAGSLLRVWKGFQLSGSLSCGIRVPQGDRVQSDFILGLGGRYEF